MDAKFKNAGLIFKAVLADKISKKTRKDKQVFRHWMVPELSSSVSELEAEFC
jgi:hypothetical protein